VVTGLGLLAVLLLILANGWFVAAEFAFVAAKRVRLEERAQEGDARAERAVAVHRELSFMLSGAQVGITVTSLAVGYISEPIFGPALSPVLGALGVPESARFGLAVTVGFLLATITQMVLGELAPKNLAIARPEAFARRLAGSVWLYTRIASPLVRLFDGASNRLLRAVGIEPIAELAGGVSAEELDLIVEESARKGSLSDAQAALLGRALEFRDLRAVDAMVPRVRVVTIPVTATGDDLRRLLTSSHTRFPVTGTGSDPSDVVGVVHAKDLLRLPASARATTPVAELVRPVLAVPETAPLHTVLGGLRSSHTELAVVVDEYGGAAGIVTLEDLVEELVGDISDEHDVEEAVIEPDGAGRWRIPGSWRLDEIERDTGLELPEGGYDTVAGLVLDRLGRIPEPGDAVEVEGSRLEVAEMEGWAVTCVLVSPAEPAEPAGPAEPTEPAAVAGPQASAAPDGCSAAPTGQGAGAGVGGAQEGDGR
jgi:CBS domain containing-hemolysin-like protein